MEQLNEKGTVRSHPLLIACACTGVPRAYLDHSLLALEMSGIEGDYHAKKQHMACGYTSTWTVVQDGDKIVVSEHCGSFCCGCVPNPCPKTGCLAHRMTKSGDDSWAGRMGGKPISLTKKPDGTLHHVTTDGPMIMTRC